MRFSIGFALFLSTLGFSKVFSKQPNSFYHRSNETEVVSRELQTNDFWSPFGQCVVTLINEAHLGSTISISSDGKLMVSGGFNHAILYYYTQINGWSPRADFNTNNNLAVANPGGVYYVALSDDGIRVAVGSPNNTVRGINSGVVQVFEPGPDGKYVQIGRNLLSTAAGDHFGRALDLNSDGTKIIIGAYGGNYVKTFTYSDNTKTWGNEALLMGNARDTFGFSVGISGDGNEAIVGAPFANDSVGFARVFDLNTMLNIQTFNGSFRSDEFGTDVEISLDGQTAIVGAPGGNYVQCLTINPSTGLWGPKGTNLIETNDIGFGTAVSITGDGRRIAIGAPLSNMHNLESGFTRTYEYNTVIGNWVRLGNDFMGADRQFFCGTDVSLSSSGQRHAIGCPGADGAGFETGQVCVATQPFTGDDDDFIFPTAAPSMRPSPISSSMPIPSNPSIGFTKTDAYTTGVGQLLVVNAPGILANDILGPNGVLSVQSCSVPNVGTLNNWNAQGGFIYIPPPNFEGVAIFTCTVSNGKGGLDTSTILIGVISPTSNPSKPLTGFAEDDTYTTTTGQALTVHAPGILANDNPGPNDVMSVQTCIHSSTGALFFNSQGGFLYVPASTFTGLITFECTISNGNGGLDTSQVIINVISTPSTPSAPSTPSTQLNPSTPSTQLNPSSPSMQSIPSTPSTPSIGFAIDDNYIIVSAQPFIVNAPGILANDISGPNDVLNVQTCSVPSSGSLTFNAQGGFTFIPLASFVGITSFTCIITNGNGGSDSSQVFIGVTSTPSLPSSVSTPSNPSSPSNPSIGFTVPDSFTTQVGQILTINAPGILANDNPGPNGVLIVKSCSVPNIGTLVSFNAQGGFTYIPPSTFTGVDVFTCTVSNNNGGSDNNQIVINIISSPTTSSISTISSPPTPQGSTDAEGLAGRSFLSQFLALFQGVSNVFQLFVTLFFRAI